MLDNFEILDSNNPEEYDDLADNNIDLEHFSIMRHSGKKLVSEGYLINSPVNLFAWDYLSERTLVIEGNKDFTDRVKEFYFQVIDDSGETGCLPSIPEISDSIDEWNMVVIASFYSREGYPEEDIEIILGNYIQEFSCLMEDWVESVLQNLGYPYSGATTEKIYDLAREHAPQNILFPEFLR